MSLSKGILHKDIVVASSSLSFIVRADAEYLRHGKYFCSTSTS